MKKLQNNFTTPEQSKRLLELGVPANSADCIFTRFSRDEKWKRRFIEDIVSAQLFCNNDFYLPCWSIGRLNEIFKICSDNHIEIYDLDLEGTQIERAMQAFENYGGYNWLDFSKLEE